jgi:hypothetical protein
LGAANPWWVRLTPGGTVYGPVMSVLRVMENGVMLGRGIPGLRGGTSPRAAELSVTPDELMARLSGLRRAQIGGKRAPHKPLLLLWLFGRFAATGSARATYAEAASPVSQLINDFGPPVKSPALERQRAAVSAAISESLRIGSGSPIGSGTIIPHRGSRAPGRAARGGR